MLIISALTQDCVTDNFMYAHDWDVANHQGSDMPVEAGKVYIMDFGQSRQFELGPGRQPAIELPASRIDAPLGMTHFDPFSWDMLSVGHSFEWISDVRIHMSYRACYQAEWCCRSGPTAIDHQNRGYCDDMCSGSSVMSEDAEQYVTVDPRHAERDKCFASFYWQLKHGKPVDVS